MKVSDISVQYVDHMGSDDSVANAARVSFDKLSGNYTPEQNAKLINYLARHKHYSPFNHTFLTFRIKAPIFVARQLVKHKFMPWNEISRRYVDSEPEFYMPEPRARVANVKQGSSDEIVDVDPMDTGSGVINARTLMELNLDYYKHLISEGVAPEVARAFLPHTLMTEWYWSGTLGAFADMLRLRLKPDTQYESRVVANLILPEIEKIFPVSIKALLNESE